jgi:16S rRNA G966 N2-methylase RsmD
LARGGWLAPGARVVCELAADEVLELSAVALEAEDQRRYGAARLVFLRFTEPGASAEPVPARHAAR